jgi:hypothetical protein
MMALLLALASSVSYGTSDFLASRVTKRLSPVLLWRPSPVDIHIDLIGASLPITCPAVAMAKPEARGFLICRDGSALVGRSRIHRRVHRWPQS